MLSWLVVIALALSGSWARSHGSVVDGSDNCTIHMDFYSAHFNVYQPRSQGARTFCEDLPAVTDTVFVLEYLHDSLRQVPVEFRMIRNPTKLGRFTRWQDIQPADTLDDFTVFHQHLAPQQDGFLTVMHTFDHAGEYVGIITAPHPVLDEQYVAVFPFRVGQQRSRWWVTALIVLPGIGWLARKRSVLLLIVALGPLWKMGDTPALAQPGLNDTAAPEWVTLSEPAGLEIHWQSQLTPLALNTLHTWTLELRYAQGPVKAERIEIDGGMPAHNHGLPTRPQVSYQSGQYLVEGLRFHMPGRWQLTLQIEHDGGRYQTRLEFDL